MWVLPIYDRTQQDIDSGSDKGFCNAADLNRLEDNCAEVAAMLGVTLRQRGSRWTASDLPTAGELDRILRNIRLISDSYKAYQTTPQPPQGPLTHWQKWNDGEKLLLDVRTNRLDNRAARSYAGELSAGAEIGVV